MTAAVLTTLLLAGAPPTGRAQESATFSIVHHFTDAEGAPSAGVVQGDDGNFYGTTARGGASSAGTIFRCTPAGGLTILHTFSGVDGSGPLGLVKSRDGNFYGVTGTGGHDADAGYGVVFRITPAGVYTNLYTFSGNVGDGGYPLAGLVQGADGNFYGTTIRGGQMASTGLTYGTIFQLTPAGGLTILYNFTGQNDANPNSALVQSADGSFYGVTEGDADGVGDGNDNHGEVFRLDPAGTFTVLHTFSGSDGDKPAGTLVQAAGSNFYGTTLAGGTGDYGTVFRISPAGAFASLHSFMLTDGDNPNGALVPGTDGNLYGTTYQSKAGFGTVFQVTLAGAVTTVYEFGRDSDFPAEQPEAGLFLGNDGNFYGTTLQGGTNGDGTIFKLAVAAVPSTFFTDEAALSNGVYYLSFSNGNYFGYYSYLSDAHYIYHFDLGYEYIFDAADGKDGVYLYDFKSNGFFYTSPTFPFPYLYDFSLNSVVYYYPDSNNAGHYNTAGMRYFYQFSTGQIISK